MGSGMGIISWVVFGLIAGALAKWIMPGKDPGGCVMTSIIGIVGAVVGGFLASLLGFGGVAQFDFRSFAVAIVGSLLLLWVWRLLRR